MTPEKARADMDRIDTFFEKQRLFLKNISIPFFDSILFFGKAIVYAYNAVPSEEENPIWRVNYAKRKIALARNENIQPETIKFLNAYAEKNSIYALSCFLVEYFDDIDFSVQADLYEAKLRWIEASKDTLTGLHEMVKPLGIITWIGSILFIFRINNSNSKGQPLPWIIILVVILFLLLLTRSHMRVAFAKFEVRWKLAIIKYAKIIQTIEKAAR